MNDSTKTIIDRNLFTVAFYNTENLFDIYDDEKKHDNDFLPDADKKWTAKRYKNKLRKLGFAISSIGEKETENAPTLIGLCEVENKTVIRDLITSKHLADCNYGFVHYDSPDERGIDVALLYDTNHFIVESSEPYSIELYNDKGLPDYTRDILLVSGKLQGLKVHVIVNHWSSRREGEKETEHKRMAASNKVSELISSLNYNDPKAKIIIMGDFNDDPSSKSVKRLVESYNLFNPMENLRTYSRGTTIHKRQWNLFDQIFLTHNFLEHIEGALQYNSANIFDEEFLKLFKGKYKGSPFRTYVGKKYKGGYSDHFPVYITLKK